jgi:hypothetical protein
MDHVPEREAMWCKVVLHDVFVGLYTNVWSSFVPFVDAGLEDAADHVNGEGSCSSCGQQRRTMYDS